MYANLAIMSQPFSPGDVLVYQIESGYGLVRVLGGSVQGESRVWHVRAYGDLFMDVDMAEAAARSLENLKVEIAHEAMTERAFDSTQTSFILNIQVSDEEDRLIQEWKSKPGILPTDRSIRLLMGLR